MSATVSLPGQWKSRASPSHWRAHRSEKQAAANDKRTLQQILSHRGPSNLVMITHDLNIADQVLEPAQMGEFFVLQPSRADFTVIGKIQLYAQ